MRVLDKEEGKEEGGSPQGEGGNSTSWEEEAKGGSTSTTGAEEIRTRKMFYHFERKEKNDVYQYLLSSSLPPWKNRSK